jgi:TfoX/Sxy family transcriptional regulator of competence genes
MAWRKSPPELIERFDDALPKHRSVERRQMFGYPACFVNGNFFVGLFQESMVIRLPGALGAKFPELHGAAGFDPMERGKGMTDWWTIPEAIVDDAARLRAFVEAAFEEIRRLPSKPPKPRKGARAAAGTTARESAKNEKRPTTLRTTKSKAPDTPKGAGAARKKVAKKKRTTDR